MTDQESNHSKLVQAYLLGAAADDECQQLDEQLCNSPTFLKQFAEELLLDCALRDIAGEDDATMSPITPVPTNHNWVSPLVAGLFVVSVAMVVGAIVAGMWSRSTRTSVAKLEHSEGAAWVSDLPTLVGSQLPPGELTLVAGIATLRFNSGATMLLEAPARVELQSDMRAYLFEGAAIMNVPESAIGFTLETPSGDAIDLGTSFAVNVNTTKQASEFEVLKGSISVGTIQTEQRVTLKEDEAVVVSDAGILHWPIVEGNAQEAEQSVIVAERVGTDGEEATFIRGNDFLGKADMRVLQVKSSWTENRFDRKAVFSFDVSDVDVRTTDSIRLRLNQVESSIGFATRLPEICEFSVYATTDTSWSSESTWDQSPLCEQGTLVGSFSIPRSRKSGPSVVESDELTRFVQAHATHKFSLIVIRKTKQIPGDGRVLVHAFASSSHPASVGPTLEIVRAKFTPRLDVRSAKTLIGTDHQ